MVTYDPITVDVIHIIYDNWSGWDWLSIMYISCLILATHGGRANESDDIYDISSYELAVIMPEN
jgi:hypothetical protein